MGIKNKRGTMNKPIYCLRASGEFFKSEGTSLKAGYYWFHTPEERRAFMSTLRASGEHVGLSVLTHVEDGEHTRVRHVARFTVTNGNDRYPCTYDLGYGIDDSAYAEMVANEILSCDCMRLHVMACSGHIKPDNYSCGDKLRVTELDFERSVLDETVLFVEDV